MGRVVAFLEGETRGKGELVGVEKPCGRLISVALCQSEGEFLSGFGETLHVIVPSPVQHLRSSK